MTQTSNTVTTITEVANVAAAAATLFAPGASIALAVIPKLIPLAKSLVDLFRAHPDTSPASMAAALLAIVAGSDTAFDSVIARADANITQETSPPPPVP